MTSKTEITSMCQCCDRCTTTLWQYHHTEICEYEFIWCSCIRVAHWNECVWSSEIFLFEALTTTRARSSESFVLCLHMKTIGARHERFSCEGKQAFCKTRPTWNNRKILNLRQSFISLWRIRCSSRHSFFNSLLYSSSKTVESFLLWQHTYSLCLMQIIAPTLIWHSTKAIPRKIYLHCCGPRPRPAKVSVIERVRERILKFSCFRRSSQVHSTWSTGICIIWISKVQIRRFKMHTRHERKQLFGTGNWRNFRKTGSRPWNVSLLMFLEKQA